MGFLRFLNKPKQDKEDTNIPPPPEDFNAPPPNQGEKGPAIKSDIDIGPPEAPPPESAPLPPGNAPEAPSPVNNADQLSNPPQPLENSANSALKTPEAAPEEEVMLPPKEDEINNPDISKILNKNEEGLMGNEKEPEMPLPPDKGGESLDINREEKVEEEPEEKKETVEFEEEVAPPEIKETKKEEKEEKPEEETPKTYYAEVNKEPEEIEEVDIKGPLFVEASYFSDVVKAVDSGKGLINKMNEKANNIKKINSEIDLSLDRWEKLVNYAQRKIKSADKKLFKG